MNDTAEGSIAEMRENYDKGSLRREDLNPDPIAQFQEWFDEACRSGVKEPNAMTLATLGINGIPSARTVLLKDLNQSGFAFFTSYSSRKAQEIEVRPGASLVFFWKELERQVIVRGQVTLTSFEESERYFSSRPYESRIAALASKQSEVIPDREWLEERDREMREKYPDDGSAMCVPLPDDWGGLSRFAGEY